jgi:hypothetical protein
MTAGPTGPGSYSALGTGYQYLPGLFETDPATGVPWTVTGVDDAEFGIGTV